MIRYAIGIAFFGISGTQERNAAQTVLQRLAALVEQSPDGPSLDWGDQWSLIDVTVPEMRKVGGVLTEVQAPVNIEFVCGVSTGTSRAFGDFFRLNAPPGMIIEEFNRVSPETLVQMRDRLAVLALERGCTKIWNAVDHTTVVPDPPLSLSGFTPLT